MNDIEQEQIKPPSSMGQSLRQVRDAAGLSRDRVVDLLVDRGVHTDPVTLCRFEQKDNKNMVLCLHLLGMYRELGILSSEFLEQLFQNPNDNGVQSRSRSVDS